jgi:hypothetical protein
MFLAYQHSSYFSVTQGLNCTKCSGADYVRLKTAIFFCFINRPVLILIYNQQDTTLHGLFYLETALHVSGGTITYHQERKQLYLQYLIFVTPLLLYATIVEGFELV